MKNNISKYIEDRLEEWAAWYTYHGDFGLGYPKKTLECKFRENGGVVVRTFDFLSNSAAEEIEKIVSELATQNAGLAQVLREQYFGVGSLPQKAKRLKISYGNFRVRLDMAKQWIAGRLSVSWCI